MMKAQGSIKKIFIILGVLSLVALPILAFAATQISVGIPGNNVTSGASSPGAFIANFYQFAIFIAGILAFAVVVYGGIRYTASAGNPSAQSDAKEWIWGALIGLVLLAGAYLVLNVINPQLTNLTLPTVNNVVTANLNGTPNTTPTTPTPSNGACPIAPLPTNPNPPTISWISSDPLVQQNLNALQVAWGKFQTAAQSVGDTYTLNSVYRPLAYQQYFYAIYTSAMQLANQPNDSNISACGSIISALQSAEQAHGVCASGYPGTTHPCVVGQPTACAPHVAGIGIDVTLHGPVSKTAIGTTLTAQSVGLHYQNLTGDPVHFQLNTPPAGSCPS
jgi:hypothetical protein